MAKKRKKQPGYNQGVDALGRRTWKKDPTAVTQHATPLSVTGELSGDQSKSVSHEEIKEYLFDMEKEERDKPEYDDVRNQLLQATPQSNDDTIDAQSVASNVAEPDSGATVDLINKVPITSGFAYSPYPKRSRRIHVSDLSEEDITTYVKDNMDILQEPGNFLGVWHDPSDGSVYLDISVVTDDAHQARKGCEDNDQIAFFDMQILESVTVNAEATSGGAK